ncbi:sensor histidine kinase [Cryptosporangium sp. NPDC051539]|uniref:sensor histidine kinase n=1 Tax=Cryptosporangium sp. NPDC051539 TaxID=3363962 RepID=UPI0037B49A08
MRVALVELGPPLTEPAAGPAETIGARPTRPSRLWFRTWDVVIVVGDPEAPGFPLYRLVALARRHAVLLISPARMRSALDTAYACGVRGYLFADASGEQVEAATGAVAAGRGDWPAGWVPAAEPVPPAGGVSAAERVPTAGRRRLVAVAVGASLLALPLLLAGAQASPSLAAAGAELAAALGFGLVWRRRTIDHRVLLGLSASRARVAERAAFSRALHDRTLQTVETLAADADLPDGWLRRHLDDEARWLRGLIESGVEPGDRDLVSAVATVVHRFLRPPFAVTFVHDDRVGPLPATAVAALAGAVSEALTNVVKHAGVDRAEVTISVGGHQVVAEVADHGRGLTGTGPRRGGFGIRHSIHGRMAEVGGSAEVRTGPQGTVVRLVYPGADVARSWQRPPAAS